MGGVDKIFSTSHVYDFDKGFKELGIKSMYNIVSGEGHAFDNWVSIRSKLDEEVIGLAVRWITEIWDFIYINKAVQFVVLFFYVA